MRNGHQSVATLCHSAKHLCDVDSWISGEMSQFPMAGTVCCCVEDDVLRVVTCVWSVQ